MTTHFITRSAIKAINWGREIQKSWCHRRKIKLLPLYYVSLALHRIDWSTVSCICSNVWSHGQTDIHSNKLRSLPCLLRGVSCVPTKMAPSRGQTAEVNITLFPLTLPERAFPLESFRVLSYRWSAASPPIRLGPRRVRALHPRGAVRQRPHHGAYHPAVCPTREIQQGRDARCLSGKVGLVYRKLEVQEKRGAQRSDPAPKRSLFICLFVCEGVLLLLCSYKVVTFQSFGKIVSLFITHKWLRTHSSHRFLHCLYLKLNR